MVKPNCSKVGSFFVVMPFCTSSLPAAVLLLGILHLQEGVEENMPPPPGWPKQCQIERCHESVDEPEWDIKRHCWRTLVALKAMMEWE